MIIKEIFSKFKDNSRTNCTFLEFQEFSRTKVIFKDFSRSVRTLCFCSDPLICKLKMHMFVDMFICEIKYV